MRKSNKTGSTHRARHGLTASFMAATVVLGTALGSFALSGGPAAAATPDTTDGSAYGYLIQLLGADLIGPLPTVTQPSDGSGTNNVPITAGGPLPSNPLVGVASAQISTESMNNGTAQETSTSSSVGTLAQVGGTGTVIPSVLSVSGFSSSCLSNAGGSSGESNVNLLEIGGTPVPIPAGPNAAVPVPLGSLLSITANVQTISDLPGSTSITVDALVIQVLGGANVVQVTVGQSECSAAGPDIDVPPTVTSVTPDLGPTAGGNQVVIDGTGFINVSNVFFGSVAVPAANVTVNSPTQITVIAPAAPAGVVNVTVVNPFGTSPLSAADLYDFIGQPAINPSNGAPPGIMPTDGPTTGGTSVTITGSNFIAPLQVMFGTNAAVNVPQPSTLTNSIVVTSPPGAAGSVPVTVTDPGGTVTAAQQFTYVPGPSVSSVVPNFGPTAGGNTVKIHGANFAPSSTVSFGTTPVPSANITYVNTGEIDVLAPAAVAGTVDVTVATLGVASPTNNADQYTYVAPPTELTVTPNSGSDAGGTPVVIQGSPGTVFYGTGGGAMPTLTVSFGATPATNVSVNPANPDQVFATSPAGSGVVSVSVTDPGGTATLANAFTYIPSPSITAIAPNVGPLGGGTTVTIQGSNFSATDTIFFGAVSAGSPIAGSVNGTGTLMMVKSPGPVGAPVTVDVTDQNSAGTSAKTAADQFTYAGVPTVTAVSPNTGPAGGGTSVTITGTNFVGPASSISVFFGSNAASAIRINSPTSITATSPAGSNTVDVVVNTAGGTSATSSADQFTYVVPPTVSSISPTQGVVFGGTSVTITGAGFDSSDTVLFGTVPAESVMVTSPTMMTAFSPPGAPGPVPVTVANAGGPSIPQAFTYFIPTPTITSITPATGSTLGGTTVTINGVGFFTNSTNPLTVMFGSSAATVLAVTESSVTVITPPGSGMETVTVTDTGGSATTNFTYYPPPSIEGITPTSGSPTGGETVQIVGSDLCDQGSTGGPPISVDFGPNPATGVTVDATCDTVTVQAPAGSGTVPVVVTTLAGQGISPIPFTYIQPGYWMVASDGGVFAFGGAQFYGSMGGKHLAAPIVAMADTFDHKGYWLFAADGGVFSFGDAQYYGSVPSVLNPQGRHLNGPIVAAEATPDGQGYRMFATDGGVFDFGDAQFVGSLPGLGIVPNEPIEAANAAPIGQGYWLVARDGGVFAIGDKNDVPFFGSLEGQQNSPVISMSASTAANGYWIFTANGGVYNFPASLPNFGDASHLKLTAPIAFGQTATTNDGYWLFASDGGVFTYGNQTNVPYLGSLGGTKLVAPIVGGIGF